MQGLLLVQVDVTYCFLVFVNRVGMLINRCSSLALTMSLLVVTIFKCEVFLLVGAKTPSLRLVPLGSKPASRLQCFRTQTLILLKLCENSIEFLVCIQIDTLHSSGFFGRKESR